MSAYLLKLEAQCRQNNIEVFFVSGAMAREYTRQARKDGEASRMCDPENPCRAGWYWWTCVPGCIPDSDFATGPFPCPTRACESALDGLGA